MLLYPPTAPQAPPASGVTLPPALVTIRQLFNHGRPMYMIKFFAAPALAVSLSLVPCIGSAKGCIKGAAVGGVAGHVAGHHAVAGAAAGCVIQHHREKVRDKAAAQQSQQAQPQPAPNAGPGAGGPPPN